MICSAQLDITIVQGLKYTYSRSGYVCCVIAVAIVITAIYTLHDGYRAMEGRTDLSAFYYGAEGIVNWILVHHELVVDEVGAVAGREQRLAQYPFLRHSYLLLFQQFGNI